jgi:hypothetical protein
MWPYTEEELNWLAVPPAPPAPADEPWFGDFDDLDAFLAANDN